MRRSHSLPRRHRTDGLDAFQTLERLSPHPADVDYGGPDHGGLHYSEIAYNILKAENQTLRIEIDRLKRDATEARTRHVEDARTIRDLKEQVRLLELQRQVSQATPDATRATPDLMQPHSGDSSMEASTFTQQQFYTPSSSRAIDLIRTGPEHSSDPATPVPSRTRAASTSYTISRYLDVDNPLSSEGPFLDLFSAHANAHSDIQAFAERDDTSQPMALSDSSHAHPPPHLHATEDGAPQHQSSSPEASVRQGALKRKRISTGEISPVERPSKRQLLVTDEHEPHARRSARRSPPAQLMTPSDTTVERSRKRKRMSPDEPLSIDHPAKRLSRSLHAVAHPGTDVEILEQVDAEQMMSPCTALLNRRLQDPLGEQGDIVTSASPPITTKSLGQSIQDPVIHSSEAASLIDSVLLGSTEQAEVSGNERSSLPRQQSSPSQSGIASMLSGPAYGSPSVREDGEDCFEREPHAAPASSFLAPYDNNASLEIEDFSFQSIEANIEEDVASSAEHQETSSPDQQRTGSGTDGTYRESDETRPRGSMEEVDLVTTNTTKPGEAEDNAQSVGEAEEDCRTEVNEQSEQPHQAAAGREEQSQNNIEADDGAEGDAEAHGNALPSATAEADGRAMTEDDRTSQTPPPEQHRRLSASIRVSDHAMLPPQPTTAMTDEASSSDTQTAPGQKATGISRSTQQDRRTAPRPRRRKQQGGSTKRTPRVAEGSRTTEEHDECTSPSLSDDGIGQDPLIRRMQLTRESYWEFGFDIDLVFGHEFPDFEPCGISLAKSAKLTTLTEGTVAKLKLRADVITDHLRRFTQDEGMDQEVNLLRCLLKRKDIHPGHSDPLAVSTTIYQQRKGCRDMINLCDFEMYSCMTVLRATNRPGVYLLHRVHT